MSPSTLVCPFCPLCCDDLVVDVEGIPKVDCPLASRRLAATEHVARIGSRKSRSEESGPEEIDRWIETIDLPSAPIVQVDQATLQEAKVLQQWVESGWIRLTMASDPSARAMEQSIARDGSIVATLGDVRDHARQILLVGQFDTTLPRLKDRLLQPSDGKNAEIHHCDTLEVDVLSALHRHLDPQPESAQQPAVSIGGLPVAEFSRRITESRYSAVVLGDAAFPSGYETVAADLLLAWIRRFNDLAEARSRDDHSDLSRLVLLRFAHQQSLADVFRWRRNAVPETCSNESLQPSIRLGDPDRNATEPIPVFIGERDPGPGRATHFLPAAMPGVHHPATVIRGDGSVALPLSAFAASPHLPRLEVLRRLVARTATR